MTALELYVSLKVERASKVHSMALHEETGIVTRHGVFFTKLDSVEGQ